jgi:hypothetical protein
MVGTDPSASDSRKIYGIDVIDHAGIDGALVPEGLPSGKDTLEIYERLIDVCALPGPSLQTMVEEDSGPTALQETLEMTALAIGQYANASRAGRALFFQSPRKNALKSVKNEDDLYRFVEDVYRAITEDLKMQDKQLRTFMFA